MSNKTSILAVAAVAILMFATLFGAIAVATSSNNTSDTHNGSYDSRSHFEMDFSDYSSNSNIKKVRSSGYIHMDVPTENVRQAEIQEIKSEEKVSESFPAEEKQVAEVAQAAEVAQLEVNEKDLGKDTEILTCPKCGSTNTHFDNMGDGIVCEDCHQFSWYDPKFGFESAIEGIIEDGDQLIPADVDLLAEEELAAEPAVEEETELPDEEDEYWLDDDDDDEAPPIEEDRDYNYEAEGYEEDCDILGMPYDCYGCGTTYTIYGNDDFCPVCGTPCDEN